MGFSTLVSTIVVVLILLLFALTFLQAFSKSTTSYNAAERNFNERSRIRQSTEIQITNITQNGQILNVTALNSGRQKIDPNYLDVYVNNSKIERALLNISHISTTRNPLHWDPDETIHIVFNTQLTNTVVVTIATPNTITDQTEITI